MSGFLKSSIARKFAMALSAFFLMFFLLQHFVINVTSIFPNNGKTFNELSHFMGTNPLIQYVMQPVLIFGVILIGALLVTLMFRKAFFHANYDDEDGDEVMMYVREGHDPNPQDHDIDLKNTTEK